MTSKTSDAAIAAHTDAYFNRTRDIVRKFGDARVTYAVFLRRPVVSAPKLMLDWLRAVAAALGASGYFFAMSSACWTASVRWASPTRG